MPGNSNFYNITCGPREDLGQLAHLRLLISLLCPLENALDPGPRGYKTFFMLNSAEHEIFSANKYENANKSWHFHIY